MTFIVKLGGRNVNFTRLKIKFLKQMIDFYNYQIITGDFFLGEYDDKVLTKDYTDKVRVLWSVIEDIEKIKHK